MNSSRQVHATNNQQQVSRVDVRVSFVDRRCSSDSVLLDPFSSSAVVSRRDFFRRGFVCAAGAAVVLASRRSSAEEESVPAGEQRCKTAGELVFPVFYASLVTPEAKRVVDLVAGDIPKYPSLARLIFRKNFADESKQASLFDKYSQYTKDLSLPLIVAIAVFSLVWFVHNRFGRRFGLAEGLSTLFAGRYADGASTKRFLDSVELTQQAPLKLESFKFLPRELREKLSDYSIDFAEGNPLQKSSVSGFPRRSYLSLLLRALRDSAIVSAGVVLSFVPAYLRRKNADVLREDFARGSMFVGIASFVVAGYNVYNFTPPDHDAFMKQLDAELRGFRETLNVA